MVKTYGVITEFQPNVICKPVLVVEYGQTLWRNRKYSNTEKCTFLYYC